MDDVPYVFIESILTRLDERDLEEMSDIFYASRWSTTAQIHVEKLEFLDVTVSLKENGNLSFYFNSANDLNETNLDDFIRMDRRFVRVCKFTVNFQLYSFADMRFEIPIKRLPEVISFMAQFCLYIMEISGNDPHFLGLLERALAETPVCTKELILDCPGLGRFLNTQVASRDLIDVTLYQEKSRDALVTFACLPSFEGLKVFGETPRFDFESLSRIVASWRRRQSGHESQVMVPTSGNLEEEFAALMPRDRCCEHRFREEAFGEYSIVVHCFEYRVTMTFTRF